MSSSSKVNNLTLGGSEKISIIGNLTTMLSAGIPLFEAVESLLEDATGNSKKFLTALRDDLVQGNHIFATLARFPRAFDKVTVSVIKASEEAGTLETALTDLTTNIQKEMEFTGKIKSAMVYPIFIMFVFFGVLTLILVVVIPKISSVFLRLKVDLPLPTRILIAMSNALLNNTVYVVSGLLVVIAAVIVAFKRYRYLLVPVLYHLPGISKLVKEIDLTRFSRSLYLMLTSGIPITTALDLTRDVVSQKSLKDVIERSRTMILSGKKFSEGLGGNKKEFPSLMVKLIEIGEKSGTLPKSMQDVSQFFDYRVSETLKTLTTLLEPLMLVVVGIFVGGMMLAIIAPIYSLIGQVGSAR